MNNSSQQKDLFEDLIINTGQELNIVIGISANDDSMYTLDIQDLGNTVIETAYADDDCITYDFTQEFNFGTEWVDKLPELYKIEGMCKEYPSLDIAFKNFKTIYELVKDDYDARKNQDLGF